MLYNVIYTIMLDVSHISIPFVKKLRCLSEFKRCVAPALLGLESESISPPSWPPPWPPQSAAPQRPLRLQAHATGPAKQCQAKPSAQRLIFNILNRFKPCFKSFLHHFHHFHLCFHFFLISWPPRHTLQASSVPPERTNAGRTLCPPRSQSPDRLQRAKRISASKLQVIKAIKSKCDEYIHNLHNILSILSSEVIHIILEHKSI